METGAIAMLAPKLPSFARDKGTVTMPNGKPTIAFIGFGEAGQAIAAGWREAGVETMTAWDILFPQAAGEKLKQSAQAAGVRCANSAADAVRGVDHLPELADLP